MNSFTYFDKVGETYFKKKRKKNKIQPIETTIIFNNRLNCGLGYTKKIVDLILMSCWRHPAWKNFTWFFLKWQILKSILTPENDFQTKKFSLLIKKNYSNIGIYFYLFPFQRKLQFSRIPIFFQESKFKMMKTRMFNLTPAGHLNVCGFNYYCLKMGL